MELAAHIRSFEQGNDLGKLQNHLITLYNGAVADLEEGAKELTQSIGRIYIGDEFCSSRLPHSTELTVLLKFAVENKKHVTLLTPVLTDLELERSTALFDCLQETYPSAEVVVNDWGVLSFLQEAYPHFRVALGRLLNKGFKDPRLKDAGQLASLSNEAQELLRTSTFDSAEFQEKMAEMGVARLERDILPYEGCPLQSTSKLETSFYFPFGYVTTGRVCWMATFGKQVKNKFVPMNECPRPCNTMTLELKNGDCSFPIIQSGNTIYYLYAPSMLASLVQKAQRENLRLVYQGFSV